VPGGDGGLHPGATLMQHMLPNALALVTSLHSLWDPSCGALTGDFRALLAMRRCDFSDLLAGAGKALKRALTPMVQLVFFCCWFCFGILSSHFRFLQELWIDRGQLWLMSLRETTYRVIGAAAGMGVLYQFCPVDQVCLLSILEN
jgi:hypothetical protein